MKELFHFITEKKSEWTMPQRVVFVEGLPRGPEIATTQAPKKPPEVVAAPPTAPKPPDPETVKAEAKIKAEEEAKAEKELKENLDKEAAKPETEKKDAPKSEADARKEMIEQAAASGGIVGVIEKLVEKLTKLFEELSLKMDKWFKPKKEPETPTEVYDVSPIGGSEKFTYEQSFAESKNSGVRLKVNEAGKNVTAVVKNGVVKSVDRTNNQVVVEVGQRLFVYNGIKPSIAVSTEISKSSPTVLGTMVTTSLNFSVLNAKDQKAIDPTLYLKKFAEERAAPPATPAAAAPAAASAAPTTGPAAASAAPTKPPEKPTTGPTATAEKTPAHLEKDRIAAMNKNLEALPKKTYNLQTESFTIQLPYVDNNEVKSVPCEIKGNTLKIGNYTYEIKLPGDAELQTIVIAGNLESGTVNLTARAPGLLGAAPGGSKNVPLSLSKLMEDFEKLRSTPKDHTFKLGNVEVNYILKKTT